MKVQEGKPRQVLDKTSLADGHCLQGARGAERRAVSGPPAQPDSSKWPGPLVADNQKPDFLALNSPVLCSHLQTESLGLLWDICGTCWTFAQSLVHSMDFVLA